MRNGGLSNQIIIIWGEKVWETPCAYDDPMDIWQFKVRLLRKKIKGWDININASIRKQK